MTAVEMAQTPAWVKQAVFYQIFPDRFARGAQMRHPAVSPLSRGAHRQRNRAFRVAISMALSSS